MIIISKKKFNQMVQEAVSKKEEELARERRIEDEFRYMRDDIRDTRSDMHHCYNGLIARVTAIEKELHPEKFENDDNRVIKTDITSIF